MHLGGMTNDQESITSRLAVYGTLAPGEPNDSQLSDLRGVWRPGKVKGHLVSEGWGAKLGYPALVLDDNGVEVGVHVFESAELTQHWPRLDAFKGDGYRRQSTRLRIDDGEVDAFIYVAA